MKITKATESLVPQIAAIANRASRLDLSEKEKSKYGFLIPYTENEYSYFVRYAEYFYVVIENEKVAGFVLAHSSAQIDRFGGEVYLHIKGNQAFPFFVIRQICVDLEQSHKGYGRLLLNFLIGEFSRNLMRDCQPAMGFIWKQPPNCPSERFHKKLGFNETGVYTLKDGVGVVGIWDRQITDKS